MKVDKHISELLYDHDCVVVPDFGGFVANYTSAKIHPTQNTFTPPSKSIIFNKNLRNNDGLLANKISTAEKTTYPEALKHIGNFTTATNTRLKSGQKVVIDEVGTLFLDVEKNIQFEQSTTNYLMDAFGLTQFQSPAIKRDTITKRIEKEFVDRNPVPVEQKKSNVKRYVAIAASLPVIAAIAWFSVKSDYLKNINYSSLNPFASKAVVKVDDVKPTAATNAAKKALVEISSPVIAKDTLAASTSALPKESIQPVTASLVENKEMGIVKADSVKVNVNKVVTDADYKFHLIAGCFMVPDNASRFVATLQNQQLPASIIGKRNGLLVVSAGDFATREEAYAKLTLLKQTQPDAWLLIK